MKDLIVTPPEGYEVDKENSTFEKIVFKKIEKRWRDDEKQTLQGYYIDNFSTITSYKGLNTSGNYNAFATEKQAKAVLAMARISQIMENDKRFGGVVTDEEWQNNTTIKYVITRAGKKVYSDFWNAYYHFLAFHTKEQRDLFLEENEDLIKDYLMID